jgi:hypothetical protein
MAEAAAAGLVYIPKHRKSLGSPNASHHHHHQQNTGIYQTIFGSPRRRARTKSMCVDPEEKEDKDPAEKEGKDGKSPDESSINSQESVYYSDASDSSMTSCKL